MYRYIIVLTAITLITFLSSCTEPPPPHEPLKLSKDYVERGYVLANSLAACGFCHGDKSLPTAPLSGGQVLNDIYGEVVAPNLTPYKLGSWKAEDIVNAMRMFKRKDGEILATEHHIGYEWMSDEDAFSIAAYIKYIDPIEVDTPTRSLGTMSTLTTGLLEPRPEVEGYIPQIKKKDRYTYGKYLVEHVARCTSCHNTPATVFSPEKYLSGGKEFKRGEDTVVAPNISTSETYGIGSWSEKELADFLQSGITPEKRQVRSDSCPIEFFKQAKLSEIEAISHYLITVKEDTTSPDTD